MKTIFEAIKDKSIIKNLKTEISKVSVRDYLVFSIGITTGLKINQILNLSIKDISNKNSISLKEEKTGKEKEYKISSDLLKEIDSYISSTKKTMKNSENDLIFTSEVSKKKSAKKLNPITVNRSFEKACKVLMIEKIGSDTLRKTFGYWYYKETNRDISYLQNLFNHSAPSVTLKYIGIDNREVKKKIAKSKEEHFIGRKKELQSLFRYIKPIKQSKKEFGGIVYIDGEAGIGKTYLLDEFKRQVSEKEESNICFFYLPCDEKLKKSLNPIKHFFHYYFNQSETNTGKKNKSNFEIGYKKFISSIDTFKKKVLASDSNNKNNLSYQQFQDVKDIIDELNRTKSIIGALLNLSWKNSLYEELEAKARFENTLYSIKNFIKASSLLSPVILQLEDAHWIDNDTKKMLKILTQNVSNYPFMIFSVNRFNEEDNKEVDLGLSDSIKKEKRVKLVKFSETKVKEFIKGISKKNSNTDNNNNEKNKKYLNAVLENSNGNPFYIKQFIENDYANVDETLTLSNTILQKINSLTTNHQEIIKTAAVMGNKIDTVIMKAIFKDSDIYEIKDGFFNLSSQNELSFEHALIKDVVYASLDDYQKQTIHKKVAVTYENKYRKKIKNYYEEIAYHYEGSATKEKTISYLEKAADFCKSNYNNDKALEYYERLLKKFDKRLNNKKMIEKYITVSLKTGEVYIHSGKLDDAYLIYSNSLQIAKKK